MDFFRKTKGAISIFLCIILTVIITLTGALVDGTRMRAGENELKTALGTSSVSALTEYNQKLKEIYGLFALSDSDPDSLKENIEDSLNKILMTELGGEGEDDSTKYYDAAKNFLFGGEDKRPGFNLFDYRLENVNVTPLYNLSEPEVMRNQIVEYMKYRAPKAIAEELLDKLFAFKDFGKQSDIMKSKTKLDKQLNKIRDDQEALSAEVQKLNTFKDSNTLESEISRYVTETANRIFTEKQKKKLEDQAAQLQKDIDKLASEIASMPDPTPPPAPKDGSSPAPTGMSEKAKKQEELAKLKDSKKALDDNITKLGTQVGQYRSGAIQAKQNMNTNVESYKAYIKTGLEKIQAVEDNSEEANATADTIDGKIKDDSSDFAESIRTDVGGKKKEIDPQILSKEKEKLNKANEVLNSLTTIINNINVDEITYTSVTAETFDGIKAEIEPRLAFITQIRDLVGKFEQVNYFVPASEDEGSEDEDPRDAAKEYTAKVKEQEETEKAAMDANTVEVPTDSVPSSRKDGTWIDSNAKYKDILEKDSQEVAARVADIQAFTKQLKEDGADPYAGKEGLRDDVYGNTEFSSEDNEEDGFSEKAFDILSVLGGKITDTLADIRDELYVNEYAIGTLTNAVTKKYTGTDKEEKDLRNNVKIGSRATFFPNNCEVEYIIGGDKKESTNLLRVKAQILLIRFALNTMSIYTDPVKVQTALSAAIVVAGWTGFGVPIVQTLILLAWSMAESILDVSFLMNGENVPIFKTKTTWVLSVTGGAEKLKTMLSDVVEAKVIPAVKTEVEGMANGLIDCTAENADKFATQIINETANTIESKIDTAVNRVFQPFEKDLMGTLKNTNEALDNFEDSLQAKAGDAIDSELNNIETTIFQSAPGLFEDIRNENVGNVFGILDNLKQQLKAKEDSFIEQIKGMKEDEIKELRKSIDEQETGIITSITDKIDTAKTQLKDKINGKIATYKTNLENSIKTKIKEAAAKGKEKVSEYVDSLGGKSKGGTTKTNLKTGFLSMNYRDYLRLFLLFTGSDTKISRIQDVIQLNMNKEEGITDFKLSNCNTYIRVEAEASMKFFFMTEAILPKTLLTEDGRYKLSAKLYKGY